MMSEEAVEREVVAEEGVEQTPPENDEVLQKAVAMGYNPDYDGPNAKTPEEFIEFGEQRTPVLKERLDAALAKMDRMESTIAGFQSQFIENMNRAREDERARTISELEQKRDAAVEEGDTDAYRNLNNQIKVEQSKPVEVAPAPEQPKIDPEFFAWQQSNSWYGTDTVMTGAADMIGQEILRANPNLKGTAFYNAVGQRMRKEMPDRFNAGTQRPAATEKRKSPAKRKGEVKWEDIPENFRRDAETQIGEGNIFPTKEDYVKAWVHHYGAE